MSGKEGAAGAEGSSDVASVAVSMVILRDSFNVACSILFSFVIELSSGALISILPCLSGVLGRRFYCAGGWFCVQTYAIVDDGMKRVVGLQGWISSRLLPRGRFIFLGFKIMLKAVQLALALNFTCGAKRNKGNLILAFALSIF